MASQQRTRRRSFKPLVVTLLLLALVYGSHRSGLFTVFYPSSHEESDWRAFKQHYKVDEYGEDGYFVRAVMHGYNLFFHTERYGWRFTRKRVEDPIHSCSGCHTPEDIAFGLVGSDRYDPGLGKRVSFEERVMRCYASRSRLDGFVPTLYDPAVRDLRIFARMVAHYLQLSEGQVPESLMDDGPLHADSSRVRP